MALSWFTYKLRSCRAEECLVVAGRAGTIAIAAAQSFCPKVARSLSGSSAGGGQRPPKKQQGDQVK